MRLFQRELRCMSRGIFLPLTRKTPLEDSGRGLDLLGRVGVRVKGGGSCFAPGPRPAQQFPIFILSSVWLVKQATSRLAFQSVD